MAYTFDQIFAVDEANPANVAKNASILIYAPGDASKTPLALTTTDGSALANPVPVNSAGFGPAFMHTSLDRVAWQGGNYTGFFTSYDGMKNEAVAARDAAQSAADSAATAADGVVSTAAVDPSGNLILTKANGSTLDAGAVIGPKGDKGDKGADGSNVLPTDTAIKDAIANPASATRGELNATYLQSGTASAGARRGTLAGIPKSPVVAAAVDLQSPYSVDAQHVHPDVVDAGVAGWNGFRYWMVVTPYPYGDARLENPCVYCSADGATWQVPTGGVNPVAGTPATVGTYNSDPDMVLVNGTMHLFYREYGATPHYERIYRKTSTDGVTWSAAQLVIDLTTGNPDHVQIISPAVVHDGTQFIMFSSKSFTTLERRTSADGVTWSAPTTKVFGSFPVAKFAHMDMINAGGGKLFALIQDYGYVGTPEVPAISNLWLARSTDWGNTWATVQQPLLRSHGISTLDIYRTTGLWETRNGADYFRLWFSGIDFDLKGREIWRVGYTEGYAPDSAVQTSGVSVPGNIEADGDVTGVQGGFRRLTARLGIFTRLVASSLNVTRARVTQAFFDQGVGGAARPTPEWYGELGYGAGDAPPVVVASSTTETYAGGARAEVRFHQRSTDITGIEARDYWTIRATNDGKFQAVFFDASTSLSTLFTMTNTGDFTPARDLIATRNVKGTAAVYSPKGDFGATADGSQPSDNPLRVMGDNIRVTTAKTPTSTADTSLNTGAICWDANYIYVKTAAGWKRAALTTW